MRIAIGNDRRGLECKEKLLSVLNEEGHELVNVGTDENFPVDYPIYAKKVAELVVSKECDRGIVICASGIGVMIAANKVDGARCGMGYDDDVAHLMCEHDDCNIIAFGQDFINFEDVVRRTKIFLNARFLGGYHRYRIEQIGNIEQGLPLVQSPIENKDWKR